MHAVGQYVLMVIATTTATVSAGLFDERFVYIKSFKYKPCHPNGHSNNEIWIKDLNILTTEYGDLDVLGTVVTATNLTAPLKASVSLRRSILGIYIPLPCIGKKFGSCDFHDLCAFGYSELEECPPLFDEHDVPCRCPIEKGVYTFPGGHFPISKTRWASILAGKYKAMIKLYMRNRPIFCYKVFFALE